MVGYGMSYSFINTSVKGLDRNEFENRKSISRKIINDGNIDAILQIKEKYNIDYILVVSDSNLIWCKRDGFKNIESLLKLKLYACIL